VKVKVENKGIPGAVQDLVKNVEILVAAQLLDYSHVLEQVHSDGAALEGTLRAEGEVDELAEAGRVVVAVCLCVVRCGVM